MSDVAQKSERKAEAYHTEASGLVGRALADAFRKFSPRVQVRNP